MTKAQVANPQPANPQPTIPQANRERASRAVAELLRALGYEPEGELADTPALVAAAWCEELLDGSTGDAGALLAEGALTRRPTEDVVVLRDLQVTSMCPHHLLPSHGHADVAYIPGERIAGFGAIARAMRVLTRRLTLQERAGSLMAESLVQALGARGAACRLRMQHTCLIARGAREPEALVESLALAGSVAAAGADRDLLLSLLR